MSSSNVSIIGMPGAGKSTLGVVVAKILGMDFIDCDIVIQKQYGKTLQALIDEHGPAEFIQMESDSICSLTPENTVISTGGSAVYGEAAMKHLAELGPMVYLKASLETIESRLGSLIERGVVMRNGLGMELPEIYDERVELYERYATIIMDVDSGDIRSNALRLARILGR